MSLSTNNDARPSSVSLFTIDSTRPSSMSSQASNLHQLLEEVEEASRNLPPDVFQDDAARKRLQEAAARLSVALESPIDGVRRLIFQVSA